MNRRSWISWSRLSWIFYFLRRIFYFLLRIFLLIPFLVEYSMYLYLIFEKYNNFGGGGEIFLFDSGICIHPVLRLYSRIPSDEETTSWYYCYLFIYLFINTWMCPTFEFQAGITIYYYLSIFSFSFFCHENKNRWCAIHTHQLASQSPPTKGSMLPRFLATVTLSPRNPGTIYY